MDVIFQFLKNLFLLHPWGGKKKKKNPVKLIQWNHAKVKNTEFI